MTRQVNRSKRKSKTSGSGSAGSIIASSAGADVPLADELRLYAENGSRLYNQKVSILKNVARRLKNGTYNATLSPKLWMYWVDAAARMYEREFPGVKFDRPTREYLSRELAVDMLSEAREYMT